MQTVTLHDDRGGGASVAASRSKPLLAPLDELPLLPLVPLDELEELPLVPLLVLPLVLMLPLVLLRAPVPPLLLVTVLDSPLQARAKTQKPPARDTKNAHFIRRLYAKSTHFRS
jgi:hypothetical protein